MTSVPVFCGKDCGGNACPMLASVEDGRVTRLLHNPAGGKYLKACQRDFNLQMETYAPDRLLHPLVRVGPRGSGQFRQASWEEALRITADRLGEVRARYGASAVLNNSSAGVVGALHATYAVLPRFLSLFGGFTRLTMGYSNAAAGFILPYLFGSEWRSTGFDAATMRQAEMIILWGANVLETRQGTAVPRHLMDAKKRGAQVVVIDPRRSATVRQAATWWLPCRPGTDSALMLAVLYVLFTENLADRSFIATHSMGFDQLERYVLGQDCESVSPPEEAHTPEWAARICGVPSAEITHFARAYAAAKPAMLFPGYSIQRVFAGEEPYRLAVALQIATANLGVRGGSSGSMNNLLPIPRVGTLDSLSPPTPSPSIPISRWPDAILEGRSGGYPSDIHALYNMGSNILNQGSDIRKNMAAFEKLDFAVSHELFMTPTARHCDVIFPAASSLEKEDIGLPWLGNYLLYKSQAVQPLGEARSDYEILWALANRLGFGAEYSQGRTTSEWITHFISQSEVTDADEFRRTGVYFGTEQERVGLADFSADPQAYPLSTPSGKVEIASQRYQLETGFPAIPTWQPVEVDPRFPLSLITPKSVYRTHSQGSNIKFYREKARHALEMNPQDAAVRGIADGDQVRLFNARGEARIAVRLTEDLTPGVVCLPEGVWVELDANGVDTAGTANMFTSTRGTLPGIACIMHGVGVEVSPVL